jgi:hypothetical protein
LATIPVPDDELVIGPELLPLKPPLTNPPLPLSVLLPLGDPQLQPMSAPQRTAATRIASMRQPTWAS